MCWGCDRVGGPSLGRPPGSCWVSASHVRHGSATSETALKTINLKDRSCELLMCCIKYSQACLGSRLFYSLKDLELRKGRSSLREEPDGRKELKDLNPWEKNRAFICKYQASLLAPYFQRHFMWKMSRH